MDLLSSPWVSILTLALGFALVSFCTNKTLRLTGFWFFAEFMCDAVSTNLAESVTATEIVIYFYLYAITSIMFAAFVIRNRAQYSKSIVSIFTAIAFLSVAFAAYRYALQTSLSGWGAQFYLNFGAQADVTFFLSVVALEALMILLGVYSALATNTNTYNSIRGQRR